ncbi:PAS domain-containing sensor histidine kinase [Silvanigrella aquatica]|uniref:histidine kinase n=1 Tax=Silvanigrella aquatica TaxID=1915309 RepID=A0A1L4D0C6_9BACT|nr:PAS domain-containing sensor histidine kinase [Silvanigrella aquatica]APJ03655.1 hypothetical protein AXG55_06935 [Silvanigrella aquatica]
MQSNKPSAELIDLSIILKRVPGYVYWKNINSIYLGCNENLARIGGFKSSDDIVGKTDYDFSWGLAEADKFVEDDHYVIRTGKVHFSEYTLPILNENGAFMTVFTEKSPLYDNNGNIIGILAIAVDISDRKEADRLKFEKELDQLKYANAIEFQKIVAQGVHDIRSPVDALLMTIKTCTEIPEATRLVIREASNRVQDIAEHLLNKFKKIAFKTLIIDEQTEPIFVSVALNQVLSEKRYRYQNLPITFKCNFNANSLFSVVVIDQNRFKRMISNLINNAVESIEKKKGTVTLHLTSHNGLITIKIQDTGIGMSQNFVKSIMSNGVITRGKQKGRGIGLFQVKDTMSYYKGQLLVNSRVGGGTQIILTLPETETPSWLAKEISFNEKDIIIILDDDPTIHNAWKIKFQNCIKNIQLKHFNSGENALDFIESLTIKEKKNIYLLIDYELLNQKYNGLDLVKLTKINRSILVTNFISNEIINHVQALEIKILPKSLASEVILKITN